MLGENNVILLQPAPYKLEDVQKQIFSKEVLKFLNDIVTVFDSDIDKLYSDRLEKKQFYHNNDKLPVFKQSPERADKSWRIAPLPNRLKCGRVVIGDVSPSNTAHFTDSLNCDAQAVQVDFDDGHCPTWKNQIQGYHNIIQAVNGKLSGAPFNISTCPILMLRPRAWNITEHNVLVNGKEVPGALIDFAILMFHCGKTLSETGSGPFFYLSKVEGASEARLWNDIFIWTQKKLSIPRGTIKACVLIENIFAAFETVEILYALREHSLGLNCGIWDYIASIISKFGNRQEFLLPDRRKHVNAENPFLKAYLLMVVKDCHERGAPATGGMVAAVLKPAMDGTCPESSQLINNVIKAKLKEINAGVDGFLVYDLRIVPFVNELWKKQCASAPNQLDVIPNINVTPSDLLLMPEGGIYRDGLKHNIAVSILFFYHWLAGTGHFFYDGLVEDSATAEISRSQVWQCIRHQVSLEDGVQVSYKLVEKIATDFTSVAHRNLCRSREERKRLSAAKYMCLELFIMRSAPDFITTYLNDSHKFRTVHNKTLLRSNL